MKFCFNNEATFHISGKVNRHNVQIWALENPQEISEYYSDFPNFNVFCAVSLGKDYGLFFRKTQFQDKIILKCYSNGFFSQISEDLEVSSFNKIEYLRNGIVMFEVF